MSINKRFFLGIVLSNAAVVAADAPLRSLVKDIISVDTTSDVMESVVQSAQVIEEEIAQNTKKLKDSVRVQAKIGRAHV